jgi:FixJ family two-component response regulator
MLEYLNRLSTLQKNVLRLIIAGYLPKEIVEELHITQKQYSDSCAAIHSYRNVSVLF